MFGPALAALLLAAAGAWVARRRPAWRAAVPCAAVLLGWGLAVPAPLAALAPHTLADHLVLPALLALAAAFVPGERWGRWAATAATVASAWWLARSGAGRPEFWRVLFGIWAAAWLLRRAGGGRALGSLTAALTALGALLLAGAAPVWLAVAAVLTTACASLAAVPPGLVASGLGAAVLGAGSMMRGRVGLVDAGCVLALVAPACLPFLSRRLPRRLAPAAPVLAAVVGVVLAWVAVRIVR